MASRTFELPELKLLVDSVQSSKFITHRKSTELIKKNREPLQRFGRASPCRGRSTSRGRIKTMNESIYYNVDHIHKGIGDNRKISFKYFEYSVTKEKVFRRGRAGGTSSAPGP